MSFNRLAGVAGFVFATMIVVSAALMGDTPLIEDDAAEVRAYLAEDQGMHRVASLFAAFAVPFAVVFFAGIVSSLRASDRVHGEAWSIVALFAAAGLFVAATIGDTFLYTLFFRGGEGLDDATVRLVWDGQLMAYSAMGPAIAALTVAVAVPALAHGAWPKWHAILGLVAAAVSIVAPLSTYSATNGAEVFSYFAFPALLLWSLATSVLLIRGRQGTESATGPAARPATLSGAR